MATDSRMRPGRDDRVFTVGEARFHLNAWECNHQDRNVCASCAHLEPEEADALRKYFTGLVNKRRLQDARLNAFLFGDT